MKVVHTFKHGFRVHLAPIELREAEKALNLHHLGTEICNRIDENGYIVPIEHENRSFLEDAHHAVCASHDVELTFNVYKDGSISCEPLSQEPEKEQTSAHSIPQ